MPENKFFNHLKSFGAKSFHHFLQILTSWTIYSFRDSRKIILTNRFHLFVTAVPLEIVSEAQLLRNLTQLNLQFRNLIYDF
jgi:uncharacterized membrane protein